MILISLVQYWPWMLPTRETNCKSLPVTTKMKELTYLNSWSYDRESGTRLNIIGLNPFEIVVFCEKAQNSRLIFNALQIAEVLLGTFSSGLRIWHHDSRCPHGVRVFKTANLEAMFAGILNSISGGILEGTVCAKLVISPEIIQCYLWLISVLFHIDYWIFFSLSIDVIAWWGIVAISKFIQFHANSFTGFSNEYRAFIHQVNGLSSILLLPN